MAEDEKRQNLSYDMNEMVWKDSEGKKVTHKIYSKSPGSLTSKSFIRAYLKACRDGLSLNEFAKTRQAFTPNQMNKAGKEFLSLLKEEIGDEAPSALRKKTYKDPKVEAAEKRKAVSDIYKSLLK